jgi:hypothetical protein
MRLLNNTKKTNLTYLSLWPDQVLNLPILTRCNTGFSRICAPKFITICPSVLLSVRLVVLTQSWRSRGSGFNSSISQNKKNNSLTVIRENPVLLLDTNPFFKVWCQRKPRVLLWLSDTLRFILAQYKTKFEFTQSVWLSDAPRFILAQYSNSLKSLTLVAY